MSNSNIAGLTVGKPAAWLMALPPLAANLVCAVAYVLVAAVVHLLFALPNPLLVAGTAASGVAVAGALLCGRKVLPGLWLARLVWDLWLMGSSSGSASGPPWPKTRPSRNTCTTPIPSILLAHRSQ